MSNSFYNHGAFPSTGSAATSASMRAELDLVAAGFDKMPTLSGNANKFVVVNSTGTALTQTSTLPSFTVTDTDFTVQDDGDNTRKFQFNAGTVTPGATRIYSVPDANTTLVGTDTTQTLTNKTLTAPVISSIVNTGSLSLPTSTDTLVGRATTDTLTNKTLTSPVISTIVNTGTLTLPTSTDTLVGRATTDTLTNKTLTSPVIGTIVNTGTLTLPTSTDTLVGRATTDTLTNKTLGAFTISGTVSGGGNQINNVIIGSSTPLAGSFTALTATGAITINTTTNNQSYTTTSTGTITISSGTAGSINNMTIGVTTPLAGSFTTLAASSTVSGTGFSTYLASPPAIGGTAPAAGSFTTLSTTGLVSLPSGGRSAAAALTVTNPAFLYGVASTYTDTASSGTLTAMAAFYSISQPTLSTNNVTTYTNAATLYIANAPVAGGSALPITNPYALYVAAGASYFGGAVTFASSVGALTVSSLTNSGLTSGRVVYTTTGGLETSSANLTFNGTTLTANTIGAFTLSGTVAGGGNQINNVIIGTTTPLAGAFTTLTSNGATTFTAGTASTTTGTGTLVITGGLGVSGRINAANFDGIVGANTAAAGSFTTLSASSTVTLSGGTASGVAYLDTNKVLTTGSALVFDATNTALSVGGAALGTAANRTVFTLNGVSSNFLSFGIGGTRVAHLYSDANEFAIANAAGASGFITMQTNGLERVRLDASGNLGLGVTPVSTNIYGFSKNLFIGQASNLIGRTTINYTSLNTNVYEYVTTSAPTFINSSSAATQYYQYLGAHVWQTSTNTPTANAAISFTQAMTLDASGNLGIGTSSPTQKLQVAGKIAVSGTNPSIQQTVQNAFLDLCGGTTVGTDPAIQIAGSTTTSDANKIFYNANAHLFRTTSGGTTYATIDTSGNLLVGTTSAGAKFTLEYDGGVVVGQNINDSANTTNSTLMQFLIQGTQVGTIKRVGATSAVIYNTMSDYRLKTVTGAVTGQGDRIDALKPIDYLWTEGGQQAKGFLAHEFQEVYASSVSGDKDAVDANGNPVYQAMQASTSEVIADLVAEIQSLRKRLAAANL